MGIRKILFVACLLCCTVVQAQFADVCWPANKGDSLLPLCSAVRELSAGYDRYSYSAHIEYPEYRRMTAEEVARYRLPERYGTLPESPAVECFVRVQAKRPQLDITFVPVVMRDGRYYRIESYKLVVDSVPLPQRAGGVQRSASERYASSSVLASGRWVRVAVTGNGVHKITDSELRKMGFKEPAKVRLYGYGGHILPETGLETLVDDLCEVPLWRENGYVLFYANGLVKWEYSNRRYVHTNNFYSQQACYFLTESDDAPMVFPSETLSPTRDKIYTSFIDYALYEQEKKSPFSYGRVLVDEHDYSQGRTMSYKIPVVGALDGTVTVDLSFATGGTSASSVSIMVGNSTVGSLSVSRAMSGEIGKIASGMFTFNGTLGDNPIVKLTHSVTDNGLTGYLDYIRLNFTRSLQVYGSQTLFRGDLTSGNALFKVANAGNDTRVWDVSDASVMRELQGTLDGGVYTVVAPADRECNLVAVNVKGEFPAVTVVGRVDNQNLHAMGQAQMVIIVPSKGDFRPAAERLAQAHRTLDGIDVAVVTAQQIYNEFSSGTPDVTAYRRLMKMLYDRASAEADAPKYLLLFGDGWYDNRLITFPGRKQENYLLCYESQNSVDAIRSYVLEDYMGFLDDSEGARHTRDKVDIGVGRIPARTAKEANAVVDKLIAYMENRQAGAWQNVVALLADDGDDNMPNQHMKDADSIAAVLDRYYPSYIKERIYWDNFPGEPSATGLRYPSVTKAINERLDKGALIVNYSGHGSANLFSHELAWKASDMEAVRSPRVPFWVTASCDIGPFDLGDGSIGEAAILNEAGGSIGILTTTRTVLQSYNSVINKAFMKEVLSPVNGGGARAVGDALRLAKCNIIAAGTDLAENKLQYVLLGDPALRLKLPEYRLVVEKFNNADATQSAQVAAGGVLTVEGRVVGRDGTNVDDFTGVLYSTLFDSAEDISTLDNTGLGSHSYTDYNKALFAGSDSIINGRFSISIPVPMDISYSNEQGMLNLFAVDTAFVASAQGHYDNFTVGGTAQNIVNDGEGPEISLYLNTPSFVDGDVVNSTPCLWVELFDENGINTVGTGIGHNIMAIVDNSPHHTYNLNSLFTQSVGDYRRGTIMLPLAALAEGEHTLQVRAWDLYNNSTTIEVSFVVDASLAPDIVQLRVNPSPVRFGGEAFFEVTHNRPQSELRVTIELFDFQGKILWSNTSREVCDGLVYRCAWNASMQGGQPLLPGVYLARAYVGCDGTESATKTIKIVVVNNK